MHKSLRVEQIVPGIRNTLEAGISPGLNMLFGNIGDTRDTLRRAVDFLIDHDDQAQLRTIRPVTPYPGSPLFSQAVERGLIKDVQDFCENKHLNSDLISANFTDLTEDEHYEALTEAGTRLLENYFDRQKKRARKAAHDFYEKRDAAFRGFRPT